TQPHQTQRLAVALRMRAPEIAHHVLLGVAPFLVSDNDATLAAKHGHTAWHGAIVGKAAIAVQFDPVRKAALDVIESERSLSMPRDFHALQGLQIVITWAAISPNFSLTPLPRRAKVHVVLGGMTLQILQPPFQFKDRLFKIERLPVHEP